MTHLAAQHKETAQIKNAFIRGADGDLSMSETFFSFLWLPLACIIIPNLLRLREKNKQTNKPKTKEDN